jgi:hypothetical protein
MPSLRITRAAWPVLWLILDRVKLGYNELGYNELGYNELGYYELGYNELGYIKLGYNEHSVIMNKF